MSQRGEHAASSDLETVAEGDGDGTLELGRGAGIGRYVILERLGAGAMGVVYAAYDPALDRRVALKFLLAGRGSPTAAARLQREAQALAKLSHPQVVAVHDVGTHAAALFVAMEFVDGVTLREWMEAERPWEEVLDMFVQAGRGLAAAHDAGVVHRDFKPENVMIDAGGRARVMDFGLARADVDAASDPHVPASQDAELQTMPDEVTGSPERSSETAREHRQSATEPTSPATPASATADAWRTRAGARLGTPAYMSPEQHLGEVAGAPADQFSFCVTLWEALYGERPFQASSLMALSMAVIDGERRPPPAGSRVPAPLRRAIERGLSPKPDTRHATMHALLAELQRARRGRARLAFAIGGLSLAGALAVGVGAEAAAPPCANVGEAMDAVWSAAARAQVESALGGAQTPYAAVSTTRVLRDLDAWTASWRASRTDACEDSAVRHEQSDELLDLRMACLDRRLDALSASVDVLATADPTVVEHAIELAAGLPDLERCADARVLRAAVPPPEDPTVADAVRAMDRALDHVTALGDAGQMADARTEALRAVERFGTIDHAPAQARLASAEGLTALELDDPAGVAPTERAIELGIEIGDDPLTADALARLAHFEGHDLKHTEGARVLARQAIAFARRRGNGTTTRVDRRRLATAYNASAVVEVGAGEYERAIPLYERAIELVEGDALASAAHHAGLGLALMRFGEFDRAEDELQTTLRLEENEFGPDHPRVTNGLINLGLLYRRQARFDEAITALERSLAIVDAAYGPDTRHSASVLSSLAGVHYQTANYERASASWGRALAAYERLGDGETTTAASVISNLAAAEHSLGRLDEARALNARALEMRKRDLPAGHPDISASLYNLGLLDLEVRDVEAAAIHLERSHAILTAKVGPDHVEAGHSHRSLGDVDRLGGNCNEAVDHYDEAIRVLTKTQGAESPWLPYSLQGRLLCDAALGRPPEPAMVDRMLAIVAADGTYTGHDLGDVEYAAAAARRGLRDARWREHAERARSLFAAAGPNRAAELAAIEAMLASR